VRFEWDEAKNRQNRRKHGVGLEVAALVFDDPNHRSEQDRLVNGEERCQTIGWVTSFYWFATHGPKRMSFGSYRLEKRAARKEMLTIMAIVHFERKPGEPLTRRQKENLKRIAEIKDEDIDFSDIPELTDEWFARARRADEAAAPIPTSSES
jgi:uncharacterized DUF497 family protein